MEEHPLRSIDDVRRSFQRACAALDAAVEKVRPDLLAAGLEVSDHSNRSGFDRSGWPYFLWNLRFARRFRHGASRAEVSVSVEYLEPVEEGRPRVVRVLRRAELFREGTPSHFKADERESHDLDRFLASPVGELVLEKIEDGCALLRRQPET